MSDAPPKLEVVPGGAGRDPAASQPPVREAPAPQRTWPRWLLLALLLLTLVGFGMENRRASSLQGQVLSLEGRVATLERELSGAREAVSAHRRHLEGVRASVAELSELVSRDPEAGTAP